MTSIKCVVIGDGTVGKTCMLMSYSKNVFPNDYVPTVFDAYEVNIMIAGQQYSIKLFDTAGQEGFDRVRLLTYPETDVFLICYSVVNQASFSNVEDMWLPEIKQHKLKCPFLLVGTKTDLRNAQQSSNPISADAGRRKAKRIGSTKYVECSALTRDGLKDVFDEAILAALSSPKSSGKKKHKPKCVVL